MRPGKALIVVALMLVFTTSSAALTPARASALSLKPVCTAAGLLSGIAGKVCGAAQNSGRLLGAGKKLVSGHLGGAAKTLLGAGGSKVGATLGLAAVGVWVLGGARVAMEEAAGLIDHSTRPQLESSWFSSSYWRMAGIAAVLTLPFLFAAAIQAMIRSDLALLARATLGYLPLAVLSVSIAAPVAMLLLAASDEMSAIASSAAGGDGARALVATAAKIGVVSAFDGSPFLAFLVGLLIAAGAIVLWLELLMREAAVYVVVLMLPLAFAALVWPARRLWAIRAVELLVALILSKFAIVAVLSLAAAALGHGAFSGGSAMLAGLVLVILAVFAPWVVVRLLPLSEMASGAAGSLRGEASRMGGAWNVASAGADRATTALSAGRSGDLADQPDGGVETTSGREAARVATERLEQLPALPAAHSVPPAGGAPAQGPSPAGPSPETPGEPAERTPGEPAERIPGLPGLWQRDDMTWRPLTLGLDDGWPPPSLDPAPEVPSDPPESPDDVVAPVYPGHGADRPADDHNPLPPEPEPENGSL